MTIEVTGAPALEPITLAEAKNFMRVEDSSTDDTLITGQIVTARRHHERMLRRSLITQTLTITLDSDEAGSPIDLPRPPIKEITSVKTYDDSDNETVTATTDYRLEGEQGGGTIFTPGLLTAVNGGWNIQRRYSAVQVIYVAGYGLTASTVPGEIKESILRFVATLYNNRVNFIVGHVTSPVNVSAELIYTYGYNVL